MPTEPTFNVSELIDTRPLGAFQVRIVVLCALVALLDGLDLQSIGLAAPGIAADLHIPPASLGAVFSAALAGLALGAFGLGLLADRVGRKAVLIGATVCFGVFTICTALAPDFGVLLGFRFFAGLGLGGAMPSFISLTSEYAPRRLRATMVALLWAGFPLGGFVGGLLASWMIPAFGWHSVFWVGGVLPLVVSVALVFALPESVGFLVASAAPAAQVSSLLRKVFPDASVPAETRFVLNEERASGVPVAQLFAMGRALGTSLLWVSFFIAFMMLVTNSAWAPTLLKRDGLSISQAAIAMAAFNLGSVVATFFRRMAGGSRRRCRHSADSDGRQRGLRGADRLRGTLGRAGHVARMFVWIVHGRRQLRSHCTGCDLLSDRHSFHWSRLGHGHGPRRFVYRAARRRLAGRVSLVDRGDFCCDRSAGAPCGSDHGNWRPREADVNAHE